MRVCRRLAACGSDAPADRREFLLAADTNGDGQITRAEFLAARVKAKPTGKPAGDSGASP